MTLQQNIITDAVDAHLALRIIFCSLSQITREYGEGRAFPCAVYTQQAEALSPRDSKERALHRHFHTTAAGVDFNQVLDLIAQPRGEGLVRS